MGLLYREDGLNIKFRIAIYMLIIPILIFYVLAAVGCVSNSAGIPNIFIFTFRDPQLRSSEASKQPVFELRVGYFGLCAGAFPDLACITSLGSDTEQMLKRFSLNFNADRLSTLSSPRGKYLLKIALDNQSNTMPFVLLAGGILFLFGLISVLLLQFEEKRVQRKPNAARKMTVLKRLMLCFVWTSTACAFAASFSTTQLARIIQRTNTSSISVFLQSIIIEPGAGLHALQWLAASCCFLFSTGISSIFMATGDHQRLASKGTLDSNHIADF
ncbi:MAG: hypothetical protein LQ349_009012 [Xanthoria aureola]|nr:MAG: hypothetical protein LQ349_009012 [Xanthoria aureola]